MRLLMSALMIILVQTLVIGLGGPLLAQLERIRIDESGRGFVTEKSHKVFRPWGFNYGNQGRLMEDFWESDFESLAGDLREMKALGANVVRVHLQVNKFMRSPKEMNQTALALFERLLKSAEQAGIYVDVTGLACYRPSDNAPWYDALPETERWQAQGVFWAAIAKIGARSPALFCYDLMNEPLSPAGKDESWYSGKLFGGMDFLQRIAIQLGSRKRGEVACQWIEQLGGIIHAADPQALVTVGMLPWVTGWGHLSGFVPEEVAKHLDFLSVHIYPKSDNLDEARQSLEKCNVQKPVVIEETFPLSCSVPELESFLLESRQVACGWIWHYDGYTLEDYAELQQDGKLTISMAIYRSAIESFVKLRDSMQPASQ
jgi:hypothetical protein